MRRYLLVVLLLACAGAARAAQPGRTAAAGASEFNAGWRQVAAPVLGYQGKSALQAHQDAVMAAVPHLEAAVSADPANISYRISLGYIYLSAGKYDKAREALAEAAKRDRKNPLLSLFRAQAEAATAFMKPETGVGGEAPATIADAKDISAALRFFDDAARPDLGNSLALVQAASVAFETGKQEVALAKLDAALKRAGMTFYRLPIPENLDPSKSVSVKMWQHAQMWQWLDLLARCTNAARMMVRYGTQKEDAGDLEGAEAVYRQVLALGKQVGNAHPNMFVTVNTGIDIMEDAYGSLVHLYEPYPLQMKDSDWSWGQDADGHAVVRGSVKNLSTDSLKGVTAVVRWDKTDRTFLTSARAPVADQPIPPGKTSQFEVTTTWDPTMHHATVTFESAAGQTMPYLPREFSPEEQSRAEKGRPQVEAWKGETGVLYIGRGELVGPLQGFVKSIDENPPASIEGALDREAESVARVMRGVGLSPTHTLPPEGIAGAGKAGRTPFPPPRKPGTASGSKSGSHR